MYMASWVNSLPIISKPLENNPDHLVWEALLTIDTHRSDTDKTRKIPKSIFITPNLNESNCPPDHKLGPDGRCYKTLKIDPLEILKTQIESLLKKNRTATTEYDEDYDYSEYGESTESMNSNGQYTVPLSLGFASDNRIPQQQQTTFPNLNRVVKDGLHVSTVSQSEEHQQPFLGSTAGIDLGSEEIFVDSEHESSASVATTSNIFPSNTQTAITIETSTDARLQSTASSTTTESVTDAIVTASSTENMPSYVPNLSSTSTESSTTENIDTVISVQSSSSSSSQTEDDRISTTDKIENVTQPLEVTSSASESTEKIMEDTISPLTPINVELSENTPTPEKTTTSERTLTSERTVTSENTPTSEKTTSSERTPASKNTPISPSTEAIEASTTSRIEITEQTSKPDVTTTEAAIPKITTKPSVEQDEEHSKSVDSKLPALSQSNIEQILKDLTERPIVIETKSNNLEKKKKLLTEKEEGPSEPQLIEKVTIVHPSVKIMNLAKEPSDDKVVIVQAQSSTIEPIGITTNDDEHSGKSDSYEVIDAYFIPSQSETPEELDPSIGKILNTTTASIEPRYRLENASIVAEEELPEAEIAPIIDTGYDGQANIELIDETSQIVNDDEKKNLTERLAEELLFQGASAESPKENDTRLKPIFEPSLENDSSLKSESLPIDRKIELDEALSGFAIGNLGSDLTTEQPVDYDSKEIKIKTDSIETVESSEFKQNSEYNGELPEKEAVPFRERQLFQPAIDATSAPDQSSIYSTFISRLKAAPPFVELHHTSAVQYSHTPFHIVTAIQDPDDQQRSTDQITTHPTFTQTDGDRSFESVAIGDQPSVHGKSLHIDINCYLKQLANKQQVIVCDGA